MCIFSRVTSIFRIICNRIRSKNVASFSSNFLFSKIKVIDEKNNNRTNPTLPFVARRLCAVPVAFCLHGTPLNLGRTLGKRGNLKTKYLLYYS